MLTAALGSQLHSARFNQFGSVPWELRVPLSDIVLGGVLGEGTFGVVYSASCRGRAVAVKRLKLVHSGAAYISPEVVRHKLEAEATLMCRLDHPHIIRFIGLVAEGHRPPAIVTELAVGSLHELLLGSNRWDATDMELRAQRPVTDDRLALNPRLSTLSQRAAQPPLSWARRVVLAHQLANGVAYLHAQVLSSISQSSDLPCCVLSHSCRRFTQRYGLWSISSLRLTLHPGTSNHSQRPQASQLSHRSLWCPQTFGFWGVQTD